MDLVSLLTQQLGVSESQAQGGAGLIFKLAKDQLGGGDFEQLKSAIPDDVESMMGQAPALGGGALGAIGGLLSNVGGGQLGSLAQLASGFSDLKMDKATLMKFLPVVLEYLKSSGGEQIKGLLEKAVK